MRLCWQLVAEVAKLTILDHAVGHCVMWRQLVAGITTSISRAGRRGAPNHDPAWRILEEMDYVSVLSRAQVIPRSLLFSYRRS